MSMKPKFEKRPKARNFSQWLRRHVLLLYGIPVVLFVLSLTGYGMVVKPLLALRADVFALRESKTVFETAIKDKNYAQLVEESAKLGKTHEHLTKDFRKLSYARFVPILSGYYQDGERVIAILGSGFRILQETIKSLEPHRVLLGFETDQELTAEQQLLQIVQVTPQLIPVMELVTQELGGVEANLNAINIKRYPSTYHGINIHEEYAKVKNETIPFVKKFVESIQPALPEIPIALGSVEPVNYLFIFQNDKEIRPTGGFITAYAIVTFENGSFRIHDSGDIYDVDPETSLLPMPRPIAQYLGVQEYNMRDTNFSPDFQNSMQGFEKYYPQTGLPFIQGIIALDTQFLEALLEFLGPVEMDKYSLDFSGYVGLPESCQAGGTKFTAENVVCRLELYAQRILDYHNDRKQILGDLMDQIVDKMFSLESGKLPALLGTITKELDEKHVLIYLHNEILQNFADSFNWAGRIHATREGVDYLHINDANLAGRKSDMYLIRTVDQKVEIAEDGTVTETVTLSYTNPKPQDNWLNNVARNYVRLYVPLGSELLSTEGDLQQVPVVAQDLNKTVFDTFVAIPPLESRTVTFTYRLPFKITDTYRIDIQKQAGKDKIAHILTINGIREEFELAKDMTKEIAL